MLQVYQNLLEWIWHCVVSKRICIRAYCVADICICNYCVADTHTVYYVLLYTMVDRIHVS